MAATLSGTYYSSITASATITLDSIPRASSVSMATGTMGSASTITITRASSAFTHTLAYSFGAYSATIVSQTSETSVSWTPPLILANQVPNATSGTGTLTCTTYNGSTAIGSKSITITLKVPTSVVPTISSLTATRVDGAVPSSWGIYVQTKSKATLTINGAAGIYGSTIASYSITGGGFSGTASSLTTGYLNTSGTITFTATVTDSRGRTSAAATVSISVVAYSPPSFTSYSSQRCNSSGTITNDGTYVKGTVRYTYYTCSSKNSVTRSTYYRKSGTTTWTNASKSFSSGTAFTFGGGNISAETTYEIKYQLEDTFTTVIVTDTVSTAAVVMDFLSGGKGVAIGKVAETQNCFEVSSDWSAKFLGTTYLGTSTLGGTAKPIYLSGGVPTACSGSVGGTAKPVYMSGGTVTACSSTVGGTAKPVYMSGGTVTACSSTVGGANKPVYMNSGTITACSAPPITSTSATVTPSAATWTSICNTGSLAAGTYLITAEARVSGSTRTMTQRILNGSAEIATTRSSVYAYSSSYYYSTFSCAIVTITAASTFYLNVYISSSASVAGYLTAVKLYG
jgi:hypothetical protein